MMNDGILMVKEVNKLFPSNALISYDSDGAKDKD